MADAGSAVEPSVVLHPLALVAISDHVLRASGSSSGHVDRVVGVLFGVQQGLRAEVFTTSEALVRTADGPHVDMRFVQEQVSLTTTVFPSYELLGCYIAKHGPLDYVDRALHAQLAALNESPLLLHMDLTGMRPGVQLKQLPVNMYFPTGPVTVPTPPPAPDVGGGNAAMDVSEPGGGSGSGGDAPAPAMAGLVHLPFKIEASEPEGIAITHISTTVLTSGRDGVPGNAGTADAVIASDPLLAGLRATSSALKSLATRVDVLLNFAVGVQEGSVAPTGQARGILRELASLAARLPVSLPGGPSSSARSLDAGDSALVELAGALTQAVAAMAVVAEKAGDLDSTRDRGGAGSASRGLLGMERGGGRGKDSMMMRRERSGAGRERYVGVGLG